MSDLLLSLGSWPSAWSWLLRMTIGLGLVVAAVVALDLLLARRVSARWRSALYLAVLLRLALPSGWASPLGLLGARHASVGALTSVVTVVATPAPAVAPRHP